jgi:sugar phosphate isomerase/epimerase
MKYGIVTSVVTDIKEKLLGLTFKSFEEAFSIIKKIGYDGVDIFIEDISKFNISQIKELSKIYHLEINSLDTSSVYEKDNLFFSHDNEKIRKKAIEKIKKYILAASELNSFVNLSLVRGNIYNEEKRKEYIISSFKECCKYAEDYDVTLLIEPLNRYEIDYINTLQEANEFIKQIEYDNVKILADLFHMNIEEKSIEASLFFFKDKIGHIHFADSNRKAPCKGHLNLLTIADIIKLINYNGFISLEANLKPEPLEVAKNSLTLLKSILTF